MAWTTAYAQGRQTGTLVGTVTDGDGLVIPGATVTVSSAALQGVPSTTTDGNGTFSVPGLSPGDARFGDARMSGRSAKTATKNLLAGLANLRFVWRRARR